MNLVVDIGNTHTKLAWFEGGRIIDSLRFSGEEDVDFYEIIHRNVAEKAIVSSVGKQTTGLVKHLENTFRMLVLLDHTTPLPIQIRYETPETLGRDRIAGCAGAKYLFPDSNALVIDMGTTITIDFINSAGEFMGGNISPGMVSRFRALHEFTARLPLVEPDGTFPHHGTDTRTAMVGGVQQGIVNELNGYMNDYLQRVPDCLILFTGGDANFFVPEFKRTIFVLPELVMTGLNFILEFNTTDNKK